MNTIPRNVRLALSLFKSLHNKTCDDIIKLILLLHREFYIDVSADIEIKVLRLRVKKRGEESKTFEFPGGFKGVKGLLQEIIKENTVSVNKEN